MTSSDAGRATGGRRRSRLGPAAALALVALSGCHMRQLIYPAPPIPVAAPPAPWSEVRWTLSGGAVVVGWHLAGSRPAPAPALLFFHGNGENLETLRLGGTLDGLAALGVEILAVDYPGYGRSGATPGEAAIAETARAAADWLAARAPGRPPVAVGWSLGAAVAVALAAERPQVIAGLVAMSPWTSLGEVARLHFPAFLVGMLLDERYDSLAAAARVRCPALVIHGRRDEIIPVAQGRRLAAALGDGARWVEVVAAGHNDLLGEAEVWGELRRFVDSLARPAAGS